MKLLSVNADAKTIKGNNKGYLTGILYLAPAELNGLGVNLCPSSTPGCRAACLYSAGRGAFSNVQRARIAKAKFFIEEREKFMTLLVDDIQRLVRKADRDGLTPCVRLNGTSDIVWESIKFGPFNKTIFELFPYVQFYDYTKIKGRKNLPKNYHLTYSFSGENTYVPPAHLNWSVVFKGKQLPLEYMGRRVINGDETDVRFDDSTNVIVGLLAKGKAKNDQSGFVIDV